MDMLNIHEIDFICYLLMLLFYLLPLWVPRLLLSTLPIILLPLLAIQWPALSRRCRLALLTTSLVLCSRWVLTLIAEILEQLEVLFWLVSSWHAIKHFAFVFTQSHRRIKHYVFLGHECRRGSLIVSCRGQCID